MNLARETRYAIQALVELARRPGRLVRSRELAAAAGVPAPFLAKALQALARAGVLASVRGGGYALARPAGQISLSEIVGAIEGRRPFGTECIFWRTECSEDAPCVLHWRWRELRPGLERRMGNTTLEQIVRRAGEDVPAPPSRTTAGSAPTTPTT
ncbi:MAG TPA: Rrf2 family transcriptional regulator [Actinomycetota bacterium]|nr:Rrf2 family transcriptional regulator [Actinomycetota bacterium]